MSPMEQAMMQAGQSAIDPSQMQSQQMGMYTPLHPVQQQPGIQMPNLQQLMAQRKPQAQRDEETMSTPKMQDLMRNM